MDVLSALFGTLTIPPAVRDELSSKTMLFPEAARVVSSGLITVTNPADQLLVSGLTTSLHRGEAECLALAMEHPGCLLLLDDRAAREIASVRGLLFTGTLGCVLEGKKRGLIPHVGPVLKELRMKARFWISDHLAARILRDVGE